MKQISLGKYHRLQQCSTAKSAISILAMDHRTGLQSMLQAQTSQPATDEQLISFKRDVVEYVSPAASAVLLDPEYGIAHAIRSGALPGNIGLIATIDQSGYSGISTARQATILPDWCVAKASRLGAAGIKLLVYYHPDSPTAGDIEKLVVNVARECNQFELPFFLETLSYSLDPNEKKLPADEKLKVVMVTARRLSPLGADILKTEFPVDISSVTDESSWAEACAELTHASVIPWILLSASVAYEIYLRQVKIACEQGASGVAVGRAVWVEAIKMDESSRKGFLQNTVHDRMARITDLCNSAAHPWTECYSIPEPKTDWYVHYPDETGK